ncbi:MAG TPA: hypothetical protein PK095_22510, partial [Myxococcota bacterium]|nr:hypothetical protein [Myxococcota bacterium]
MGTLTLLVDGRVHCPLAPSPRASEPSDLLIGGGRILALAPAGALRGLSAGPIGEALRVIDLEGRALIPGLVDAHVHLGGGGGEGGFKSRVPRVELGA